MTSSPPQRTTATLDVADGQGDTAGDGAAALDEAVRRSLRGEPPWRWFDRRVQTHHEATGRSVGSKLTGTAATERLSVALAAPRVQRPRAIYIHVPFCAQICSFCAFYRGVARDQREIATYGEALRRAALALATTPWASAAPIDAVYVGGGTPTTLNAAELAALIRLLRERFALSPACEITVEARCAGLTPDALETLRAAGVNRLSFGVQSFTTDVRRDVGRLADRGEVLATLEAAQRAGFDQLSVDLIYNLPRETATTWQHDLDTLATTPATAASVYALIAFPRSALQRQITAGTHPPLGGLDQQYERFCAAATALTERPHWQALSGVHYGDRRIERSVYNRLRSRCCDVLGIGAGAGGRIGEVSYMSSFDATGFTRHTQPALAPALAITEPELACGLKTVFALSEDGALAADRLARLLPQSETVVAKLVTSGLVTRIAERLQLTRAGRFWSYNISALLAELIRARLEEY